MDGIEWLVNRLRKRLAWTRIKLLAGFLTAAACVFASAWLPLYVAFLAAVVSGFLLRPLWLEYSVARDWYREAVKRHLQLTEVDGA